MPQYVAEHPAAVWLVGPFFAAVTGLAFKEVRPSSLSFFHPFMQCTFAGARLQLPSQLLCIL